MKKIKIYDTKPQVGSLITITGQMFLDLLEKLGDKVKLIQSNTDGIIIKTLPTYEEEVLNIVKEWCDRMEETKYDKN